MVYGDEMQLMNEKTRHFVEIFGKAHFIKKLKQAESNVFSAHRANDLFIRTVVLLLVRIHQAYERIAVNGNQFSQVSKSSNVMVQSSKSFTVGSFGFSGSITTWSILPALKSLEPIRNGGIAQAHGIFNAHSKIHIGE